MNRDGGATVVVIAKSPRPGKVKTRLSPPYTPTQASTLARLALEDTLAAVSGARAGRRVLALEGAPGPWLPGGFDVMDQRGRGLGERIANLFAEFDTPTLLIGMDTPQLSAAHLEQAIASLLSLGTGAVLGPTPDGGYWALGMRQPDPAALVGVPMSSNRTFAVQRRRLEQLGLATVVLESVRDVDDFADAVAVAEQAPHTRFGRGVGLLAPIQATSSPA